MTKSIISATAAALLLGLTTQIVSAEPDGACPSYNSEEIASSPTAEANLTKLAQLIPPTAPAGSEGGKKQTDSLIKEAAPSEPDGY